MHHAESEHFGTQLADAFDAALNCSGTTPNDSGIIAHQQKQGSSKHSNKKAKRQGRAIVDDNLADAYIGIVKWFDNEKGYGVIISNDKVIVDNNLSIGSPSSSIELFIHHTDCDFSSISAGEWVSFWGVEPRKDNRFGAINVRRLVYDKNLIRAILKYTGQFARIKGCINVPDSIFRREQSIDFNIFNEIIQHGNFNNADVRDVLCEYISSFPQEQWQEKVNDFVSCSSNILTSIYLYQEEYDVADNDVITILFQRALPQFYLAQNDWNAIERLPQWFAISSLLPEICTYINSRVHSDTASVDRFLKTLISGRGKEIFDELLNENKLDDEALIYLYVQTGNEEFLNQLDDIYGAKDLILGQSAPFILGFLQRYITSDLVDRDSQDDPILSDFNREKIAEAIRQIPEDEQYLFASKIPEPVLIDVVWNHLRGSNLYNVIMEELWERQVASIEYCAFDLESNGDEIREWAFIAGKGVQFGEGEVQLNTLLRALRRTGIIVGHNVKKWDIGEILSQKGFESNAFIWDTLEIEILLNPCRYAYALHAKHTAKDDVQLANDLFWDQLYRISKEKTICEKFTEFFPPQINEILLQLQKPWFADYFASVAKDSSYFFQAPSELDEGFVAELKGINDAVGNSSALIVAPRELWGHIAHHIDVSFPFVDGGIEYFRVIKERVANCGLNTYLKAVLERFSDYSKTPIPANLAQYLRIEYFGDDVLCGLVSNEEAKIKCIDVDMIRRLDADTIPENVYFIGLELVNRLHQYKVPGEWDSASFIDHKCWIPMKLAASSCVFADDGDVEKIKSMIGPDALALAQNIWIERLPNGKYSICYSIDLASQTKFLTDRVAPERINRLKWGGEQNRDCHSFKIVTSAREMGKFDPRDNRVTFGSSRRDAYWTYQFKMLDVVQREKPNQPVVYILEDDIEIEAVKKAARAKGYALPVAESISKKAQFLSRHRKAMLVLPKRDLYRFLALKSDVPYSFVWDGMAVEKCMMMWRGMPFGDEAPIDNYYDSNGMRASGSSPRDAMLSAWPIYRHYYDLMLANNAGSSVYLLDPYLDDYPELADAWHVESLAATLWNLEEEYGNDLEAMAAYFPRREPDHVVAVNDEQIAVAKEVIGEMLLPKDAQWHDYQNAVLTDILSKEHDYIISIPTGGGKSILFQGPALYNSMQTNRLSIVITPLKALMEDQINGLVDKGFGLNVDYLNSDRTYFETRQIYRRLAGGEISLLYVTPERFRSRAFVNALDKRIIADNGLEYFIFDEAHCVSQWGQEFRPDYLHVMEWCQGLKSKHPRTCVTMYSATVTGQIENDIRRYLQDVVRIGQSPDDYNPIRNHISMDFRATGTSDNDRRLSVMNYIREKRIDVGKSRMLVFCLFRAQCEDCASDINSDLIEAANNNELHLPNPSNSEDAMFAGYFHAGMSGDERENAFDRFKSGETPFLCATKAFGMGMDIPNVHYIVHYSPPRVLEDYLQEVGRAGRNESLYRAAGFGPDHPIPAVCLVAKEDFRQHADKLKTGQLVWSDLEDVLDRIKDFITSVQTISETQSEPVVIPTNLWSKEGFNGDTTMFRIALHWLEQLKRIKLGYSQPANITVEISEESADSADTRFQTAEGMRVWALYQRLRQISRARGNNRVQVTQSELRIRGRLNSRLVMDTLVKCVKYGLVSIEQSFHCATAEIRFSEVRYAVEDKSRRKHLALHWVFELARIVASRANGNAGTIFALTPSEEHEIYKELRDQVMSALDNLLLDGKDANGKPRKLMPWYNRDSPSENIGFYVANNYKKDFEKKRRRFAYALLSMLPGVTLRSFIDKRYPKQASKSIRGVKQDAVEKLSQLESDCWNVLEKIYGWQTQSIKWTELMRKCDLEDKGFDYFSGIVYFLSMMGYVQSESLLPFGIEVYTTPRTEDYILEEPDEQSEDFLIKKSFDEVVTMRVVRLAAMEAFSKLKHAQHNEFIRDYFRCSAFNEYMQFIDKYAPEDDEIMAMLSDKTLKAKIEELDDEQRIVYEAPLRTNINVLAGPGSGKTHVLTLRCARLIYKEGVDPRNILVLAYNRAVVVELKSRLEKLFRGLGLSRRASKLHVHTFHSLAKRLCGSELDGLEMEQWEGQFVKHLKNAPNDIRQRLGQSIQYVLIDEFQDITQKRLDAMVELKNIYPYVSFFTIGDKNQSIYGFERRDLGDPVSPNYYYEQLDELFHPVTYNMMTNYRSYQGILDAAAEFIPPDERAQLPHSSPIVMQTVPQEQYVHLIDSRGNGIAPWYREIPQTVEYARSHAFTNIAIFFRTNVEVYQGYTQIKDMVLGDDVRIRIQGQSACELWRTREIYEIIRYLSKPKRGERPLRLANYCFIKSVKRFVRLIMRKHPNWDKFYLDLAYTIILDCAEEMSSETETFTYANLVEMIKDATQRDDGQIYKIYERHSADRIDQSRRLNIILTTMHRVKGLEFDAVVITPSFAALPLNGQAADANAPLTTSEIEDIEEERRLLFVAYTRAKKLLRVYKLNREFAVERVARVTNQDREPGYRDEEGLGKLFISYLAQQEHYHNNDYVKDNVARNDPIRLESNGRKYIITHGDTKYIGRLATPKKWIIDGREVKKGSDIQREIECRYIVNQWPNLEGLFVNDVFVWTYGDTLASDRKNGKSFADMWCAGAKERGFIYVVDFAGYAREVGDRPSPPSGIAEDAIEADRSNIPCEVAEDANPSPFDSEIAFFNGHSNSKGDKLDGHRHTDYKIAMQIAQKQLQEKRANRLNFSVEIKSCSLPYHRFDIGQEIQVRGLHFNVASQQLHNGAAISFKREPSNQKDPNAVLALDNQGRRIGYVAKETAPLLSRFIANGGFLMAIFDGKINNDWYYGFTNIKIVKSNWEEIKQ